MIQPLVSIWIITYNQRHFIYKTLDSVLEQDYDNLEIVVADDGSTDGTAEIILDYAHRYPRKIVPLVGGPNLGITGNSNRGLEACTGKYIAFLGGDDVMLPGKISKQVGIMEAHPECALSYHDLDVFDSDSGKTLRYFNSGRGAQKPYEGGVETLIRHGVFCGACSVMIRSDKVPVHGFDQRLPVASDWLFWIETVVTGGSILFIPEILGRYRRHSSNVTSTNGGFEDVLTTVALVDTRYPEYSKHTRYYRAVFLYSLGVKNYLSGNGKMACFYFGESFRYGWVSWKWGFWFFRSLCSRVLSK
jgi:glycosyltransferase involved in cell wall biosynthesis